MCKVIAEIGCNHKGDLEIAKEMIQIAASCCKVDIVKFQKRNNTEYLTPEQYNTPHPNPYNSYGNTYGEHRDFLEFSLDQHQELKEECEKYKVEYCTSVWDLTSAKEIVSLKPNLIKIPSACNNNEKMLKYICENYTGEIHCSVGMTTQLEVFDLSVLFKKYNRSNDLVLYACTSGYPVPFEDCCIKEITKLIQGYKNYQLCKEVGYSGHHLGIAIDNAAVALGATIVERHFTLDRTWKGTDHAASLEPDGLRRLVRDLKATSSALTYKNSDLLEIEIPQRNKLKK